MLQSWETLPGANEGRTDLDAAQLRDWLERARADLAEAGRAEVGDITIGNLFAHAPIGADGIWPHPAVRDVIEELRSERLERGFQTGIFNSRGMVSRDLNEGGAQERALAERYAGFSQALHGAWPRTAAVLRRIAERYQDDAADVDDEAELWEDLG